MTDDRRSSFVQITNRTRNACLASRAQCASTVLARCVGLLGRSGLAPGDGLLLEPCQGIHSLFMRFPFDALYLDREGRIVHLIQRMPPNRLARISFRTRRVVELPAGTVAATGTLVGDVVDISPMQV